MNDSKPLEGQCALVTGGGTGIGAAIAEALAAAGATVVINYAKSGEAAEQVAKGIRAAGGQALTLRADVSHEPDVLAMFAEVIQAFGTLDILVNNAGIQRDAPLLQTFQSAEFKAAKRQPAVRGEMRFQSLAV